jgi:hypothetical protein
VSLYDREILLICRNKTNLWFALNYLGKQGFKVNGAENYISALEKIYKFNPYLVIFYNENEEREIDYIKNISSDMVPEILFFHFDGPIHLLPEHISRIEKKGN